jgi:hypothetical protein
MQKKICLEQAYTERSKPDEEKKKEECTFRERFHVLEQRDQLDLMKAEECDISDFTLFAPELDNERQIEAFFDVKPEEHAWRHIHDHELSAPRRGLRD